MIMRHIKRTKNDSKCIFQTKFYKISTILSKKKKHFQRLNKLEI